MPASGSERDRKKIIIGGSLVPESLDESMIRNVVHGFCGEIRGDPLSGPIFMNAIDAEKWPLHLQKMCNFWSATLLRTDRYQGRPLPPHLEISDLGEIHFRRWLTLFRASVRHHCPADVAALFMSFALRIAHSFRLAVAFHRKDDTLCVEPIVEASL
jgi:hemoglobin